MTLKQENEKKNSVYANKIIKIIYKRQKKKKQTLYWEEKLNPKLKGKKKEEQRKFLS